jgi:integrase
MIMEMPETESNTAKRQVWNAGRAVGAKRALKPKQIWEIRFYLNQRRRLRDRALFDLAIDSKLRGCDLVRMKISDLVSVGQAWLERRGGSVDDYVFLRSHPREVIHPVQKYRGIGVNWGVWSGRSIMTSST